LDHVQRLIGQDISTKTRHLRQLSPNPEP
jgi:hypothetical protein